MQQVPYNKTSLHGTQIVLKGSCIGVQAMPELPALCTGLREGCAHSIFT